MATITTDTFLDGGTARTAGEAWTMNGGVLTIRTDTRWHANAPASMTGSIGATTTSATLGGGVLLDGRNVREVQYDTGSGTVPAIGTSITQGGVSGYLLGVWADLASAPTAVGGAMPATGFIKFREVTGGSFAAGALTGISANATGADTTSWIEVVQRQAVANTVPRLGFYRTRGAWYTLPQTTDNTAHQTIQIPTNGGGAGTRVPCVWIETGVGTNVYEKFPAVLITWFNTTNLGTDERSKFVLMDTNGTVRIGGDGTNVCGFIPPSGCRIRIPNILGRQSTLAGVDSNNLVPFATLGTRPDFTTTAAGDIDFEYFMNDWYQLFTAAFRVRMINCATMDVHSSSNMASPTELENYAVGAFNGTSISLTQTNNPLGGTITDCKFYRAAAVNNGHSMSMIGCSNYVFNGTNETGVIQYARLSGLVTFGQCRNFDINGVFYTVAVTVTPSTSFNFDFERIRYIDRLVGTTNATVGKYVATCLVSSDNIVVNNVDFGGYANVHPYLGVFNFSNSSNLKLRCGNTFATPIGGATNAPANIFVDSGNNDTVKVQNCHLTATRTGIYTHVNTSKNITCERLTGTVGATLTRSVNALVKGLRSASNSVAGQASVYGTHFFDMFESDTAGRVWLAMNEPTAFSASRVSLTLAGSTGGFTSGGQVSMPTVGDVYIAEMADYAIGHTALANAAAVLSGTGTGNFSYEYQIDLNNGSGYNSYQTLNGANLSAHTISPTLGFKLRYRITCTNAVTTNAITYVRINTVSTLVAQENASYPQDTAFVNLSGYVLGTRIQVYNVTDDVEIYNSVPSATSVAIESVYTTDKTYRIRAMYQSGTDARIFVEFSDTFTINGLTRTVPQDVDNVYVANGINGSTVTGIVIDDAAFLVDVDLGTLSLQMLYAYETFWLQTEEGIRDEQRFINAVDQANYIFENFQIRNVSDPTTSLVITGGYMVDSVTGTAIELIDTSGGTIFLAPEHVVPFASGSGLSADQNTTLNKINTLTENVGGLRFTNKALEEGAGGGAAPTEAEIYTYFTTSDREDVFKADVSAIPTNPLLTTDARLNNIDATISSRASEANATTNKNEILSDLPSEPDNAGIAAIQAKTDNLPVDPASETQVNTRLAAASYEAGLTPDQAARLLKIYQSLMLDPTTPVTTTPTQTTFDDVTIQHVGDPEVSIVSTRV